MKARVYSELQAAFLNLSHFYIDSSFNCIFKYMYILIAMSNYSIVHCANCEN